MMSGQRPQSRGAQSRGGLRTANLRTANGQNAVNYGGVGLNTNVSVQERPVTQHGMVGMRVGTAGPKRQVQDTSYYISLLRAKCSEISTEISKLGKEHDKLQADNQSYVKYERQYEDLIKLVRNLEGKLADFNLAMDKARDSTDPEDVVAYQQQLAYRNAQEKKHVDAIFVERQRCEEEIRHFEEKLSKIRQMEEYKVSQLTDRERERYYILVKENQHLGNTMAGRKQELDNIHRRIKQGELALQNDHLREEFQILSRKLDSLKREKENFETELEASRLDPKEARARMLDKVKADNQKIQDLQKKLEHVVSDTESKRRQVAEIQTEIEERRSDPSDDGKKYEVLFQRDQEMTQFLETFEDHVTKELEEQKRAQKMIVGLLEHTSRHILRENNLPDQEHFNEMKDSLTFKKRQLESSASTQEQLEKELEKRRGELEKINTLDSKIDVELKSLTSRMDVMRKEMVQFVKIDELREEADATREELIALKRDYQQRRDDIKCQVSQLSSRHDKKKAMLADNETARTLEGLEQKLRHYEQTIFHLNEFIIEKELETDFQSEREECGRIVDELNALHIQSAANEDF